MDGKDNDIKNLTKFDRYGICHSCLKLWLDVNSAVEKNKFVQFNFWTKNMNGSNEFFIQKLIIF